MKATKPVDLSRSDLDCESCLNLYREGFYPYFDNGKQSFRWEREQKRAVILLGESQLRVAKEEIRRQRRAIEIKVDGNFDMAIALLSDERLRSDTWIKHGVVSVYTTLYRAGFAHTVEAYADSALVGCLIGIRLGSVFCAEAMLGVETFAAPRCLYSIVADFPGLELDVIDVQVPHKPGSPCWKLGEQILELSEYLALIHRPLTSRKDLSLQQ